MSNENECYIYVIGPETGPVKVGSSMNPTKRLQSFVRERGAKLFLMGQWPVGRAKALAVERHVHWQLREKLFRGEWFNVDVNEAEAAIRKSIDLAGQLDRYNLVPVVDIGERTKEFPERIVLRLPLGTVEKIKAVRPDNDRSAFIREAIEAYLATYTLTPETKP